MIRGDQHVDEWAGVAVDYLDGRLDGSTKSAVEAHLSGCPDCAARMRKQQYVVRLLHEAALDDPPQDLEYRSIGELVFPSPGGQPLSRPMVKRPAPTPRWYRGLRAWAIPTVAVIALIGAVVAYGIVRSGPGAQVATDSSRAAVSTTIAASAATTATTAAPAFGASATVAGAELTVTTAGATTTSALAGAPPATDTQISTLAATQDPKAMVQALQTAQAPTFVSFQTAVAAPAAGAQGPTPTGSATETTTLGATDTTGAGTPTTAGGSGDTPPPTGNVTMGTVSADQAAGLLNEIKEFTGLEPLDRSLWLGGPTFAVFLPRADAAKLVDMVRSIGSTFSLIVTLDGAPPLRGQQTLARLLEHKSTFPVLAAHRALQPSIVNYDFTTSTLGYGEANGQTGSTTTLPDEAGTHVVVVILIAE